MRSWRPTCAASSRRAGRLQHQPRDAARTGGRAGPRQRSQASRGVFHRLARNVNISVHRLWHSLRYGIFRQTFVDGRQVEQPDAWLALGSPWEFPRRNPPSRSTSVGTRRSSPTRRGPRRTRWVPGGTSSGSPTTTWSRGIATAGQHPAPVERRRATKAFDLAIFNSGDYVTAVQAQTFAEHLKGALSRDPQGP